MQASTGSQDPPIVPTAAVPTASNAAVQSVTQPAGASSSGTGSLLDGILSSNPYFSAGFGLMGVGVGLTVLRRGGLLLSNLTQRRLLVSLEIPSRDKAYPWFLEWMAKQSKDQALQGRRSGFRMFSNELSVETNYKEYVNGSADVLFSLVPGVGTHFFKYRGAWMQVKRDRQTKMMDMTGGRPFETLKLTTLSRDRHLFPALLEEARQVVQSADQGRLVVHAAWGTEWVRFGHPRRKRPFESVILADGVSEKIRDDLVSFLSRSAWYAERGLPYRRGYLLHGPPGSGKSSFIRALAGSLNYDICILNLSQRGMMDDKLNHLLLNAPERSFVLLEDIDAAFNKRVQTSADGYQSGVTFSGLLNALDGVASAEERIVFMTTNHLENLDPALIRPGRVDVCELIDDATPSQAKKLFIRFYGNKDGDKANEIEELAGSLEILVDTMAKDHKRVTMASLQGHFIMHSAAQAVASCHQLFSTR
ncbi:hypothetical protein FRC03_003017 [Tulasnella sp. 419]|nr:hypothetical protein FRC02_006763 [Tulasnella sp. 418]KAG8963428.1 hypothetical protein FRC03_003017 [Tulasnella sp. 419]